MFLDIAPEYTAVESSYKSKVAHRIAIRTDKNMTDYTATCFSITQPVVSKEKTRIAAPENLKRGMYKMSSKAISKVLS